MLEAAGLVCCERVTGGGRILMVRVMGPTAGNHGRKAQKSKVVMKQSAAPDCYCGTVMRVDFSLHFPHESIKVKMECVKKIIKKKKKNERIADDTPRLTFLFGLGSDFGATGISRKRLIRIYVKMIKLNYIFN